jgi:hypothetical protein
LRSSPTRPHLDAGDQGLGRHLLDLEVAGGVVVDDTGAGPAGEVLEPGQLGAVARLLYEGVEFLEASDSGV